MNKPLPTVTIAVAAYNEEANIRQFLRSVMIQKEEGYRIKEIVVYSDGSTDRTVQNVRDLQKKDPRIRLVVHATRVGKSTHLNTIYTSLTTDFLVQSDADVRFAHPWVVRELIAPMMESPRVGMCGGNPKPANGTTVWEAMVRVAFEPYLAFRSTVRGGNNAFSAVGQLLAYRRALLRRITVPADMVTNDIFTYFCCLKFGWQYRFAPGAAVFFQSPRNLRDIIRQNTRFQTGYARMYDYFPAEAVRHEVSIPPAQYATAMLLSFLRHPILAIGYYGINTYCRVRAHFVGRQLTAKWPIAETTKEFLRWGSSVQKTSMA